MLTTTKIPILEASLTNEIAKHPFSVSSSLKYAKKEKLSSSSTSSCDEECPQIGGIISGKNWSWLSKGPVFALSGRGKSNSVISSINFNKIYAESEYTVTVCTTCRNYLLIGLKGFDGRGLIAFYDPVISKLFKIIDVPYPVSSIELISSQGGAVASSHFLSNNLRLFFGIAAVGTEEGHLYLIDLRFDCKHEFFPKHMSPIEIVPLGVRNLAKLRENSSEHNTHLAYELQASCHEEGVYHFAHPDDEIIQSYYPSEVTVTSLLYEPRAATLFVGFSFGQFQIFSLHDLCLVFSSQLTESSKAVVKFAFQEPENDPRNCCYLWIAQEHQKEMEEEKSDRSLSLSMYQLMYLKKETHHRNDQASSMYDGSGDRYSSVKVLYKDLEYCGFKFELSLGAGSLLNARDECSSRLLLCSVVEKYPPRWEQQECVDDIDIDDYYISPSSSLCVFAWQSWTDQMKNRKISLVMFDLNRWYLAHMPSALRLDEEDSSYVAFWSFDQVDKHLENEENLLGMEVIRNEIRHFESGMRPLQERFFLPSACTFYCALVTDEAHYKIILLGRQQQVLTKAMEYKSMCLANPKEMYQSMVTCQLFSHHSQSVACTPDMMRENILTSALEHCQKSFLLSVLKELACGHLAACGCTLRFFMDWSWKSVATTKDSIDKLCVPIFDCTCSLLDNLTQSQLDFHTMKIGNLKMLFQKLMDHVTDSSEQSKEELQSKLTVVTLIHQYLNVVHWFISNGLLPEQMENVNNNNDLMTQDGILIYKYSRLRQIFDRRREEINHLNCPSKDLLLIDGWVEEIGEQLTSRWQKQEGGETSYPPPSFMTLLDMYYLDCVDLTTKHCLVMYLLLDVLVMFSQLDENKDIQFEFSELQKNRLDSIGLFLHNFSVPVGIIKLTEAFWLLDHKKFEDSLDVFLDADTTLQLCSWQERRILRSYLYQGHPNMALKYISTRHPKVETIEDAKMHVTICIMSREPLRAWNLVQSSAGHANMKEMFTHLFDLCQQHSQLDEILKLPFTAAEEAMVINYLQESNSADMDQILVLFHLQRSRYVDAIRLHSQCKHYRYMSEQSDRSRHSYARLDHIVKSYTNLLPKVQQEVIFSSDKLLKRPGVVRREVSVPKPLSAVLHARKISKPMSHAALLSTLMDKINETRTHDGNSMMTPFRKKPARNATSELPLCDSPITKYQANTPRSSKFIFASAKEMNAPTEQPTLIRDVYRRRSSFGGSPANTSRQLPTHPSISRLQSKGRRKSSLSMAAMLLQTPPIIRKSRSSLQDQDVSVEMMTPHSILKVKHLRRHLSPSLSGISQNSSRSDSPKSTIGTSLSQRATGRSTDRYHIIDSGLESTEDDSDWSKWKAEQVRKSKMLFSRLCSTMQVSEDHSYNGVFVIDQTGMPVLSTPARKDYQKPALQKSALDSSVFETPKKLRFAGLNTSENDTRDDVTVAQMEGVSHLTPVRVRAEEEQQDDTMEIDIMNSDTPVKSVVEQREEDNQSKIDENLKLEKVEIESVSSDDNEGKDEDIRKEYSKCEDDLNTEEMKKLHTEREMAEELRQDDNEVICLDSSSDDESIEPQHEQETVKDDADELSPVLKQSFAEDVKRNFQEDTNIPSDERSVHDEDVDDIVPQKEISSDDENLSEEDERLAYEEVQEISSDEEEVMEEIQKTDEFESEIVPEIQPGEIYSVQSNPCSIDEPDIMPGNQILQATEYEDVEVNQTSAMSQTASEDTEEDLEQSKDQGGTPNFKNWDEQGTHDDSMRLVLSSASEESFADIGKLQESVDEQQSFSKDQVASIVSGQINESKDDSLGFEIISGDIGGTSDQTEIIEEKPLTSITIPQTQEPSVNKKISETVEMKPTSYDVIEDVVQDTEQLVQSSSKLDEYEVEKTKANKTVLQNFGQDQKDAHLKDLDDEKLKQEDVAEKTEEISDLEESKDGQTSSIDVTTEVQEGTSRMHLSSDRGSLNEKAPVTDVQQEDGVMQLKQEEMDTSVDVVDIKLRRDSIVILDSTQLSIPSVPDDKEDARSGTVQKEKSSVSHPATPITTRSRSMDTSDSATAEFQEKRDNSNITHLAKKEKLPTTPVVVRVRNEPTFVLSPPVTRSRDQSKKLHKSAKVSPRQLEENTDRHEKTATPIRSVKKTRRTTPASVPEFLFSPPTTRTRSSHRKKEIIPETTPVRATKTASKKARTKLNLDEESDHSSVTTSPTRASRRNPRTKAHDTDSDQSSVAASPTRVSRQKQRKHNFSADSDQSLMTHSPPSAASQRITRAKSDFGNESDQSSVTLSPAKSSRTTRASSEKPESPPSKVPSTPTRKTVKSPGRKSAATPTRSSSRVKAKIALQAIKEDDVIEKQITKEVPAKPSVTKRGRKKRDSTSSDVLTSEAESEDSTVSIRRSGRTKKGKSAWSPSQDKTRLLPLTPLPEEEEQEEKSSKRRKRIDDKKPARVTKSSANPIKMRKKMKVLDVN